METVQLEGKRTVARDVEHYNLDAINSYAPVVQLYRVGFF
jgi:hypothetical protein